MCLLSTSLSSRRKMGWYFIIFLSLTGRKLLFWYLMLLKDFCGAKKIPTEWVNGEKVSFFNFPDRFTFKVFLLDINEVKILEQDELIRTKRCESFWHWSELKCDTFFQCLFVGRKSNQLEIGALKVVEMFRLNRTFRNVELDTFTV